MFDATDLEPAWNDFEELVWPALAQRIPVFEELKLTGGWAGYYDCNKLDNNAVVGKHPKYDNVYICFRFFELEKAFDFHQEWHILHQLESGYFLSGTSFPSKSN